MYFRTYRTDAESGCSSGRPLTGSERLKPRSQALLLGFALGVPASEASRPLQAGFLCFVFSQHRGSWLLSEQRTRIDSSCILLASGMLWAGAELCFSVLLGKSKTRTPNPGEVGRQVKIALDPFCFDYAGDQRRTQCRTGEGRGCLLSTSMSAVT